MSIPSAPIKTPLGQDELRHRTRGLGQRYRTVLLLVDGRRPLGDVLAMAHQAGAQTSHFEELVRLGLVELPQTEALPEVMETAPGALDIPKLTSVVLDVHLPDLVIEPVVASAEPSVPLHELPVLSSWVPSQDTAWPDLPAAERPVLSLAAAEEPEVAPVLAPALAPVAAVVQAPAQKPPPSAAKAKSPAAVEAPKPETARPRAAEAASAKPAAPSPSPAPAKAAASDDTPARKQRRSSRRAAAASIEPVLSDATPIRPPDPAQTPRFEPLLDEPVELQPQALSKPPAPDMPRLVVEPPPAQAPTKKRPVAAAPSPSPSPSSSSSQRVVPTLTHQQPAAAWLQVRTQPLAMALEAEQDEEASEQILQQVRSLLTHALGGDAALFAPLVLSRVRSAPTARALIGLVWEIERHRGHIRRGRLQLLSLERARDLLGMGNTLVAGDSQAGSDWPDTQQ
ncbi:MAG: hypothetical protein RLZZ618_882 [Pseudomonadota bacterium]|jgi:hypothetical protein